MFPKQGCLTSTTTHSPFIQESGFMDSDTFYALVLMLLGFGLSQSKEPYWHYYTFQFIQESGFTDSDTFYALVLMLLGFGLSQSKGALLALLHIL